MKERHWKYMSYTITALGSAAVAWIWFWYIPEPLIKPILSLAAAGLCMVMFWLLLGFCWGVNSLYLKLRGEMIQTITLTNSQKTLVISATMVGVATFIAASLTNTMSDTLFATMLIILLIFFSVFMSFLRVRWVRHG